MLSSKSVSFSKYLLLPFFDYSIAEAAFDFLGSSTGSKYLFYFVSTGFNCAGLAFGASSQSSSKLLAFFFSG
jgi:hypothetical protein